MFDIYQVINKLKTRRRVFVSEADFQLEMAWVIKEEYPDAKVRLEYCPSFDKRMHIDILVIIDNKWIPIELKYKTKGCIIQIDGEEYILKEHSAKDVNCYLYLKDIQRIERIKQNVGNFAEGYTVFITNQLNYTKAPRKADCVYKMFSLEEGIEKSGILEWSEHAGAGTKKNNETPIELNNAYTIKWDDYSSVDDSNTGTFKILINRII